MTDGIVALTIAFIFLCQALRRIKHSVLDVKKGKLLYIDKETINLTKGIFMRLEKK